MNVMKLNRSGASLFIITGAVVVGVLLVSQTIFGATSTNITSQVIVGIAAPTVTGVTVNNGSAITLTANVTTNVNVDATINDSNSCTEITGGTTTILLYRNGSGVSSSSCLTSQSPLNCYLLSAFTASSSCSSGVQNTTTTFAVQYFAQATDASSAYSGQKWFATVLFKTADNTTGTGDSNPGQTLNTLLALNVTTSTITYGTIGANTNSGSTDQVVTSTNAGNSSTSLQVYALTTLTAAGIGSLPTTTTQTYSTSTFTFQGTSTFLTGSAVTVTGFLLTSPTSTTNVAQPTFWGIQVPNNQATGTYSGTNVFQALFNP